MKKIVMAGLVCGAVFYACAEGIEDFGGIVKVPARGKVAIFSSQKNLTEKDVRGFFLISDRVFELNYEYTPITTGFAVADATRMMTVKGANVAIFLVDDPALPMTMVALEEKWGLINFAKLTADNPKTLLVGRRAEKLFTRVMTQLLGGGMCLEIPFSAMKPIFSVSDLDRLTAKAVAPAHLTQMSYYCKGLGLSHPMKMPYLEACEAGFAPAPTNAIQKAIWDEVHALPTKPIKILPPSKKK